MNPSPAGDGGRSEALLAQRNALSAALTDAAERSEILAALERALVGVPGVDGAFVLLRERGELRPLLGLGSHRGVDVTEATVERDERRSDRGRVHLRADPAVDVTLPSDVDAAGDHLLALSCAAGSAPSGVEAVTALALFGEAWAVLGRLEVADSVTAITHDLQAPLTALLGFTSTMRHRGRELSEDERLAYLETMERQIRRIAGLVDDMLVGARLEAGVLAPDEPEPLDLAAVAEDIATLFGPEQRRRILIRGRTGVQVRADRRQLERAVQNLVDNALKYAPPPSPVIVAISETQPHGLVSVSDRGPGIPAEGRAQLFTRYGRPGRPRRGSTGLGLYIVRGIAEAHGGEVTVDSAPGHGATFTLRLPRTDR